MFAISCEITRGEETSNKMFQKFLSSSVWHFLVVRGEGEGKVWRVEFCVETWRIISLSRNYLENFPIGCLQVLKSPEKSWISEMDPSNPAKYWNLPPKVFESSIFLSCIRIFKNHCSIYTEINFRMRVEIEE